MQPGAAGLRSGHNCWVLRLTKERLVVEALGQRLWLGLGLGLGLGSSRLSGSAYDES